MSVLKRVAKAIAPVAQRVKAKWDGLDRYAPDFRSHDDLMEWIRATRESNAQLKREQMKVYARAHMLPRVSFGQGLLPTLLPATGGEGGAREGGLSPRNRDILDAGLVLCSICFMSSFSAYMYWRRPQELGASAAPLTVGTAAPPLPVSQGVEGQEAHGPPPPADVHLAQLQSRLSTLERHIATLVLQLAQERQRVGGAGGGGVTHDSPVSDVAHDNERGVDSGVARAEAGEAAAGPVGEAAGAGETGGTPPPAG